MPQIIEFADIGRYIDEPVKHYSSGMVVRLGFAVVAALKPDLLITDEVLAVGDESFQKKCVRWMEDYLDGGGTLILVSHSMYHVQKLCRHACWLKHGEVAAYGDVFDVTQAYLAYHERKLAVQSPTRESVVGQGLEFHLLDLSLNELAQETPLLLEYKDTLRVHVARAFARWSRAGHRDRHCARRRHTGVRRQHRDGRRAAGRRRMPTRFVVEIEFPEPLPAAGFLRGQGASAGFRRRAPVRHDRAPADDSRQFARIRPGATDPHLALRVTAARVPRSV